MNKKLLNDIQQLLDYSKSYDISFENLLGSFLLDHPDNLEIFGNLLDHSDEWKIELSDYISIDFYTFLTDVRICLEAQI